MAQRRHSSSAEGRYIPIGMAPGREACAETTERVLAQLARCRQRRLCGEGRESYAQEQRLLRFPDPNILSEQAVRPRISKLASNDALSFLLKRHADDLSCQRQHIVDFEGAPRKINNTKGIEPMREDDCRAV